MKRERLDSLNYLDEDGDVRPISDCVLDDGPLPYNSFICAGIDYAKQHKGVALYQSDVLDVVSEIPEASAAESEHTAERLGDVWLPRSIEDHQQNIYRRDLAREAFRDINLTAYEELGGGLISHRPPEGLQVEQAFDAILRHYQPWQRDVRIGVESLGILEMTPAMIDEMNKSDRQTYARHFEGYMDRLSTNHRLIAAAEGKVEYYPLLEKTYGTIPTPGELIEYSLHTLEPLYLALRNTGLPQKAFSITHQEKMSGYERAQQLKRDKHRHGEMQLVFKKMKNGEIKPCVRREK